MGTTVAIALIYAVSFFGQYLIARHAASSSAEAIALAGAIGGRVRADVLAAANNADIISYNDYNNEVVVIVRKHGQTAIARAQGSTFSTLNVWPSPTNSSP